MPDLKPDPMPDLNFFKIGRKLEKVKDFFFLNMENEDNIIK